VEERVLVKVPVATLVATAAVALCRWLQQADRAPVRRVVLRLWRSPPMLRPHRPFPVLRSSVRLVW
jgi:hypothetical protein